MTSFAVLADRFHVRDMHHDVTHSNILFKLPVFALRSRSISEITTDVFDKLKYNYGKSGFMFNGMWTHDLVEELARVLDICIIVVNPGDNVNVHFGTSYESPVHFVRQLDEDRATSFPMYRFMAYDAATQADLLTFIKKTAYSFTLRGDFHENVVRTLEEIRVMECIPCLIPISEAIPTALPEFSDLVSTESVMCCLKEPEYKEPEYKEPTFTDPSFATRNIMYCQEMNFKQANSDVISLPEKIATLKFLLSENIPSDAGYSRDTLEVDIAVANTDLDNAYIIVAECKSDHLFQAHVYDELASLKRMLFAFADDPTISRSEYERTALRATELKELIALF